MRIGDTHAAVHGLHVSPGVLAGTTAGLADLVYQVHLQAWDISGSKKAIDPVIGCHPTDEIIDHCRDGLLPA
jgi:hypothetical protein